MQAVCQNCENDFEAKRSTAKYCSARCRVAANRSASQTRHKRPTLSLVPPVAPVSTLRAKPKPAAKRRIKRILKRHATARPLSMDRKGPDGRTDLHWLWAAYKKGSLEAVPEGLSLGGLKQFIYGVQTSCELYTLEAVNPLRSGVIPVGMVGLAPVQNGQTCIVNALWFAWASKRNVIETAVAFVAEFPLILETRVQDETLLNYLKTLKLVRRVGTLQGMEGEVSLWQGVAHLMAA